MAELNQKRGLGAQWRSLVADKAAIDDTGPGDAIITEDRKLYIHQRSGGVFGGGITQFENNTVAEVEVIIETKETNAFQGMTTDSAGMESFVTEQGTNTTTLATLDNDDMLAIQDGGHVQNEDTGTTADSFVIDSADTFTGTLDASASTSAQNLSLEKLRKYEVPSIARVSGLDADGADNPSTTNAFPTMTTNADPSPNVASTSTGSTSAFQAFDNILVGSGNFAEMGSPPAILKIFFGAGQGIAINKYRLFSRNNGSSRSFPRSWVIEGSNNDATWAPLDARIDIDDPGNGLPSIFFTFLNSVNYDYYRIDISEVNDPTNNCLIMEWQGVLSQPSGADNGIHLNTQFGQPAMGDTANNLILSLLDGAVL